MDRYWQRKSRVRVVQGHNFGSHSFGDRVHGVQVQGEPHVEHMPSGLRLKKRNEELRSHYKRFVSFYFTNVPKLIMYFYLRKGFQVCGMCIWQRTVILMGMCMVSSGSVMSEILENYHRL